MDGWMDVPQCISPQLVTAVASTYFKVYACVLTETAFVLSLLLAVTLIQPNLGLLKACINGDRCDF